MSISVKLTPFALKYQAPEQVLSQQFSQVLADGELEFLEDRWLSIHVCDVGLEWCTSAENNRPIANQNADADVSFGTDTSDLLTIVTREQDSDTLFFQRRLVTESDTELGLYVENLMGAIGLEQVPKVLRVMLMQSADFIETRMKTPPETKQTLVGESY